MNTEEARLKFAQLGRDSLYFLCKGILFQESERFHYHDELHAEMASVIEDPEFSKKLLLVPRGHFKTTIGTKGRAIQWAIRNPNERILIVSATTTNAERFLRQIRHVFEANPLFRWLYPEVIPDFSKVPWSNREASIRRTVELSEPTFDTAGIGTALPSRHYTKIIKDDPVNDKNSNTQELMDQVIEWDASTIPLFDSPEDPSNEELVIGTPWSLTDLYSIKRKDPDYAVYIRHVLENQKGESDYEAGESIFPERFPRKRIERIRARLSNDDLFWCQYMCDPHGTGSADFKREWVQYFEHAPDPLAISITVDPGGLKDMQHSDPTAIVVVGVDIHNNWFVLNRINMRLNPREIIDTLFDLYEAYPKTHTIGVETVAWQRALRFFAQEEMRKRGKFLPILELRTDTRVSKPMRIRGLIPRFSNQTIFIHKYMTDLEDQLFKRSKNDDLVDALAYQLQVAVRTPQQEQTLKDFIDPWSIDAILMELAKKKLNVGRALENCLVQTYEDPQVRFRQMEDMI